jgi:hypothetical protein
VWIKFGGWVLFTGRRGYKGRLPLGGGAHNFSCNHRWWRIYRVTKKPERTHSLQLGPAPTELDLKIQSAGAEELRSALKYTIEIIENYRLDINSAEWFADAFDSGELGYYRSLAEAGFCQGRIYRNVFNRIESYLS